MNVPVSPLFRGSRQLEGLVKRMEPLAAWMQAFRPECRTLTLSQQDFDLLRKYPEGAAALHNIIVSPEGITYWRGFTLRPEPAVPNPKPQLRP